MECVINLSYQTTGGWNAKFCSEGFKNSQTSKTVLLKVYARSYGTYIARIIRNILTIYGFNVCDVLSVLYLLSKHMYITMNLARYKAVSLSYYYTL